MISVAMATYNGEKYIKEQINSILQQTYQDFEIVICDDCSRDKTREILLNLAEQDKRIKVFFNQRNLGFKKNFEKAVTLSNGEYIAFSDQDDIWTNDHLEVLINNLGSADISCADSLYVNADNISLNRTFKQAVQLQSIPDQKDCFLHIFFNSNYVQGACMLMKADFAKRLLPIPENVPYHDCWYSMNAALENGIVFTDKVINRYRQHGKNVTANVNKFEKLKKIINLFILKKGFYTDRFYYFDELEKLHTGLKTEEFIFTKEFINLRRQNKTTLKQKKYLKSNFLRIMSFNSKKAFFENWLKWKNWTPTPIKNETEVAPTKDSVTESFKVITETFNCKLNDIKNIQTLKKGMTNRSYLFSVNNKQYIMRIPGEGTEKLINREQEAAVYNKIKDLRICDDLFYINSKNGFKITAYLENARVCDAYNFSDVEKCLKKLKAFHELKIKVDHSFNLYGQIDFYESLWSSKDSSFEDYVAVKENVLKLKDFVEKNKSDFCLTHIDAICDNFLFTENDKDIKLIDWEYAGMQDPHVDIAMFCIYAMYQNKTDVDKVIDLYFDNNCSEINRIKIYCYISICGLLWSNWCVFKSCKYGIEFGDYNLKQYQFAKEYYEHAISGIKKIEARNV